MKREDALGQVMLQTREDQGGKTKHHSALHSVRKRPWCHCRTRYTLVCSYSAVSILISSTALEGSSSDVLGAGSLSVLVGLEDLGAAVVPQVGVVSLAFPVPLMLQALQVSIRAAEKARELARWV